MVGTPSSSGCANCRKRKKKCGEELPACVACTKAGWKCPGYSSRWKFVEENSRLSVYYRKKRYVYEEYDLPGSSPASNEKPVGPRSQWKYLKTRRRSFGSFERCQTQLDVPISLISENERCGCVFGYFLRHPKSQTILPLYSLGTFFDLIPVRLGLNPALDTTIWCLCAIYSDILNNASKTSCEVLRLYSESLSLLRTCVDDPERRLEPETLCASIILQVCELMVDDGIGCWNSLSVGSSSLIQSRGPERHVSYFERSMLESQRVFLIVQAMRSRQNCFLSQPEWRRLLQSPAAPSSESGAASICLRSKLNEFLIEMLDLALDVARLYNLASTELLDQAELDQRRSILFFNLLNLCTSLQTWHSIELEPLVVISSSSQPSPSYPTMLSFVEDEIVCLPRQEQTTTMTYPDILIAILDCVTNMALIQIEKVLHLLSFKSSKNEVILSSKNLRPFVHETMAAVDLVAGIESSTTTNMERRRRVRAAYDFVKSESAFAVKPLEVGMRQLLSAGRGGGIGADDGDG